MAFEDEANQVTESERSSIQDWCVSLKLVSNQSRETRHGKKNKKEAHPTLLSEPGWVMNRDWTGFNDLVGGFGGRDEGVDEEAAVGEGEETFDEDSAVKGSWDLSL